MKRIIKVNNTNKPKIYLVEMSAFAILKPPSKGERGAAG